MLYKNHNKELVQRGVQGGGSRGGTEGGKKEAKSEQMTLCVTSQKSLFWWDPARGQCAHRIVIWGLKKGGENNVCVFLNIGKKANTMNFFSGSAMITQQDNRNELIFSSREVEGR